MNVSAKSKSGVEAYTSLRFYFTCPNCGWENEMQRLNPHNGTSVVMEDGETHDFWCHKCDYEESFILTLN